MLVRRIIALAVFTALVAVGCGFGLNTGNPTERAAWDEKAAKDERAVKERVQREVIINQIINGTLPETTTTLIDPERAGSSTTMTLPPSTTTTEPVVGPAWCYEMVRFVDFGNSLFTSSSPELFSTALRSMEQSLGKVAAQASPAVKQSAVPLVAKVAEGAAEMEQITDRVQLRAALVSWATANEGLLADFIRSSTAECHEEPMDLTMHLGG